MNMDMITKRLELRGYRVVAAADALRGITLARAEAPDLILMDVNLPDVDGWEATRRLKAEAATRDIPVVALTAHAMDRDRDMSRDAGCDGYESKPIDFPRLVSKMETLLTRRATP
jgi:two-component system cell cycle response regulator DivK